MDINSCMKFDSFICIVPARGGSQSIPDKNLKIINRKPLVSHSIEFALSEGLSPENIIVSSNDNRILNIAEKYKVIAHERPERISGNLSSTESALIDVCKTFSDRNATDIITLQPTSPIRFKNRLTDCVRRYREKKHDSLLTVTKFYDFFWYEVKINRKYEWVATCNGKRPMKEQLGKQDFKYFDNGNIYISNIKMLLETECRIGEKVCVFPITELEGMQIDSQEDLYIFRSIYKGIENDMPNSGRNWLYTYRKSRKSKKSCKTS